jgi:IS5 family transposase
MTRWRQRIGAERLDLLRAETLAAAQRARAAEPKHVARVTVDTTVQPKAVTHPTDSKLVHRGVEILGRLARRHGIALRQSYTRVSTRARREVVKLIHRGRHREADRVVRRMRTWLGRLARDITRKIAGAAEAVRAAFATPLARIAQLLRQRRDDRGREKIYALHAPEVECIAGPQPRCAETRLGTRARARPARASNSGARSRSPPPTAQRRAERS